MPSMILHRPGRAIKQQKYTATGGIGEEIIGQEKGLPYMVNLPDLDGHTQGGGMSIGMGRGNPITQNYGKPINKPNPLGTPNTGSISNTYSTQQQNPIQMKAQQDYDRMMQMYQGLLNRTPGSTVRERLKPVEPATYNYTEDPRLTESITGLEDLAENGGYSSEDIANLRARGISPIRAVYANAQRELERSKNLSGGYSPNMGAVSAKMAREMSDLISGRTSDVNAGIAEKVAQGKLQAAPQLADLLRNINTERNSVGQKNIDAKNRAGEVNASNKLKEQELDLAGNQNETNQILQSLEGMTKLFGTNNQLTESFMRDLLSGKELDLKGKELNQRGGLGLIDALLKGMGRG